MSLDGCCFICCTTFVFTQTIEKKPQLQLWYTQRNILAAHKYIWEINVTSHFNNASIGLYLFLKIITRKCVMLELLLSDFMTAFNL